MKKGGKFLKIASLLLTGVAVGAELLMELINEKKQAELIKEEARNAVKEVLADEVEFIDVTE